MSSTVAKDSLATFQHIMSEEIDKQLQNVSVPSAISMEDEMTIYSHQLKGIQLKSDEETAKVMQIQYDKEYNILKYLEEKFTGSPIASSDFKEDVYDTDSSEEEFEDLNDEESEEFYSILEKYDAVPFFNCKYTKRRKVCEDNAGFNIKKIDKNYNRVQAQNKLSKYKICEKKENRITVPYGVNDEMRRVLYSMMDQQILEQVNDIITFGNHSAILHITVNAQCQLPVECAIMMFKTVLPEHNKLGRRASRKLLRLTAEKEIKHLEMLRRAGVSCPTVFGIKGCALMISFLGRNKKLAPKLNDASISDMKMMVAYSQIEHYMRVMFNECKLIHGNLSEYNILWFDNNCYILNVFGCVETHHKNAFHLLFRDCVHISKFFRKRGVPDVATPERLFKDITGWDYVNVNLKETTLTKTISPILDELS